MPVQVIENGDIFARPTAEMIVCPVNVVGSMGKGLALEFRNRFPGIWMPYRAKCDAGWKKGEVLTLLNPPEIKQEGDPAWIVCYPSKYHWKHPSNLIYIQQHMSSFYDQIVFTGIKSVGIPALGAGLGQLKWSQVRDYLLSIPWPDFLEVKIYAPL